MARQVDIDIDPKSPIARKLGTFVALTEPELLVLDNLHRSRRTLTFRKARVSFDDFDGLVAAVDFDKSYLDHEGPMLR